MGDKERLEVAVQTAIENGWDGARYLGEYNSFHIFEFIDSEAGKGCRGCVPSMIAFDKDGNLTDVPANEAIELRVHFG